MKEPKFLKAAEGRLVHQEDGKPWPVEGMAAPSTLFVRRRIADGDLVEAKPEAPAAEEPGKEHSGQDESGQTGTTETEPPRRKKAKETGDT